MFALFVLLAGLGVSATASAQASSTRPTPDSSRVSVAPSGAIVVGSRFKYKGTLGYRVGGGFVYGPDGKPRFSDYPKIQGMIPDSPAARAGIVVGDDVVSVNGEDARAGGRVLVVPDSGQTYHVRIRRGEELLDFTLVSVLRPSTP